jgi:hypothetical protein
VIVWSSLAAVVVLAALVFGWVEMRQTLSPVEISVKALAALRQQPAWKAVVTQPNGQTETDWWSANSSYYRCDFRDGGNSSSATDGEVLFGPGPDGRITAQPVGAGAPGHLNPTEFTTYYSYLADGKPLRAALFKRLGAPSSSASKLRLHT